MEAMKYGKGETNKGIKRVTEIIVADKLANFYAFPYPIPSVSLATAVRGWQSVLGKELCLSQGDIIVSLEADNFWKERGVATS